MKPITILTSSLLVICAIIVLSVRYTIRDVPDERQRVIEKRQLKAQMKKARIDYFNRMLMDPATGTIPSGIRNKELQSAINRLKTTRALRSGVEYDWRDAGPVDVGGRTRALAIDRRDSDVILAGGVSGGMWKSVDQGQSWTMKSDPKANNSVTAIVQDPNNPDTWYYTMGEFTGNSTASTGALFQGAGIFKSVDNGESWSLNAYKSQPNGTWKSTDGFKDDPTTYASPFDFISRIVISPVTGSIFIASSYYGIFRSTDQGSTFENILADPAFEAIHFDVVADSSGLISATIAGLKSESSGLYLSLNDGASWTNFTPASFPEESERSVLAFAPSNQELIYMLTNTGLFVGEREDVRLFRLDLSDTTVADLSQNLPQFNGANGNFNTQLNYNMVISIKPDDENTVLVGGVNLYRSTDALNTPIDDEQIEWIGGFGDKESFVNYPNHHPDQHVLVWDPESPDMLWCGNDGGIYKTNIADETVTWEDLNYGYRVTQYYTAALSAVDGDFNLLGGTQDNGSPGFNYDFENDSTGASVDLSGGDGSFSYIGNAFIYVSSQNGTIYRLEQNGAFNEIVSPVTDTLGTLFIHPYVVEPVMEEIMYYPSGNDLLINTMIKESNVQNFWTVKSDVVGPEFAITALSASTNPQGILFLAAYDDNSAPKIIKYIQATDEFVDISIPGAPVGAYPHHIAINAEDANEFIVVFTNYNINGTHYTSDGGQNYSSIEANLLGNADNPGPSIRTAAILNTGESKLYYLGTSTGIYCADVIDGNSTSWVQEAEDKVGFSVVSALASREIDDVIIAATHGRGMFVGIPTGFFVLEAPSAKGATEVTDTSFVAHWDTIAHAVDYRLKIASDPDLDNLLDGVPEDGLAVEETAVLIYNLPANQKFYYAVQGASQDRRSPSSNVVEVETLFNSPEATEATEITSFDFEANWLGIDGAEFYVLDVATDALFENFLSGHQGLVVNGTSKTVGGVAALTEYFYRVKAAKQSRNNDSKYSNTISLSTPEITSIEGMELDAGVRIYPVPSRQVLNISSKQRMEGVRITNTSGRELLNSRPETQNYNLDISGWNPGLYIALIELKHETIKKKILVR